MYFKFLLFSYIFVGWNLMVTKTFHVDFNFCYYDYNMISYNLTIRIWPKPIQIRIIVFEDRLHDLNHTIWWTYIYVLAVLVGFSSRSPRGRARNREVNCTLLLYRFITVRENEEREQWRLKIFINFYSYRFKDQLYLFSD